MLPAEKHKKEKIAGETCVCVHCKTHNSRVLDLIFSEYTID